jgi:uncharacterized protein involved in response to NO
MIGVRNSTQRHEQAVAAQYISRRNIHEEPALSHGLYRRAESLRTFLSYGFRPFFLAAAGWSAIAIGLWIAMLTAGLRLPTRFDPLSWHIHEMLFGFVLAAVAGFLLTAIPSWTGRRPVSGALLGSLVGLWLLARIDAMACEWVAPWLAIAIDIGFPLALAVVVAREIISARNRRNYPIIALVVVLGAANLLMDLSLEGFGALASYGWRLALAAILILVSVIGGRIVPAFTRNWLVSRRKESLPSPAGVIDRASLGVLHAALMVWVFLPTASITGFVLLAGAVLNLWRLAQWRGTETRSEPLLLILHIGYGWLVLGVAALGVATLNTTFPLSAAIHALTAGAIGTMILAVMTRVTRGHTGRELTADIATNAIYGLVILAAAVRVAAALDGDARSLLLTSGALWIGAFGLFVVRYAPLALRPRRVQ